MKMSWYIFINTENYIPVQEMWKHEVFLYMNNGNFARDI